MPKTQAQKEAAAAKRQQGWQEAGKAISEQLNADRKRAMKALDAWWGTTKAMGKGVSGKGGRMMALTSGVITAVKDRISDVPNAARRAWTTIRGVFKGIFNHPDWYKYQGKIMIPAFNALRPFDPKSLKSAVTTVGNIYGPTIGVTHVVQNNLHYTDVSNTEAFELATIQAFKDIRQALKSNLPYSQEDYNDYIRRVMAFYCKAKQVERVLGWYNVVRADIPELQDAISSVSANTSETGIVSSTPIKILQDIAQSLSRYEVLQTLGADIGIPQRMAEYLSWWVGATFIDQAAPNPQLYLNYVRDVPILSVDNNGNIISIGSWDIANGSIDDIINEGKAILNDCGIMNADIVKCGTYGRCYLQDVGRDQYQPICLADDEFFAIMINSYTLPHDSTLMQAVMKDEYVRVDALESMGEANMVGLTNAISTWAKYPVPLAIVSQCAYFTSDPAYMWSAGAVGSVNASATGSTGTYRSGYNNIFVQITSNGVLTDEYDLLTSATSSTLSVDPTRRFSVANGTVSGATVGFGITGSFTFAISGTGNPETLIATNGSTKFYLMWDRSADGVNTPHLILQKDVNGVRTNVVTWLDASLTVTTSTNQYSIFEVTLQDVTAVAATVAADVAILAGSAADFVGLGGYFFGTITVTTLANTLQYSLANWPMLYTFVEQVDYHLPVITHNQRVFKDVANNKTRTFIGTRQLLKECYIPLLLNLSDVQAVLYHMYLGLFSIA